MPYIANKPIRFDKNYKIGEVIPENIIDPKMVKRFIDWGKIIKVSFPETSQSNNSSDNKDKIPDNKTTVSDNIENADYKTTVSDNSDYKNKITDNKVAANTENNTKNEKKSLNKATHK